VRAFDAERRRLLLVAAAEAGDAHLCPDECCVSYWIREYGHWDAVPGAVLRMRSFTKVLRHGWVTQWKIDEFFKGANRG
jgi:hypothetical protein